MAILSGMSLAVTPKLKRLIMLMAQIALARKLSLFDRFEVATLKLSRDFQACPEMIWKPDQFHSYLRPQQQPTPALHSPRFASDVFEIMMLAWRSFCFFHN